MANRNSSRGGSRGSSRSGSRTAPSTNMAAYAFAVVALVAIVIILVVVMGGKDEPRPEAPSVPVSTTPVGPAAKAGPVVKPAAPYPKIDDALISKAKALVKTFDAPAAAGDRLYDDGMRAKKSGDDKTWQKDMEEAMSKYQEIQDAWNELIAQMPKSKDYDEEQVANYYLGHEGNQVTKYLTRLQAIRKTLRPH